MSKRIRNIGNILALASCCFLIGLKCMHARSPAEQADLVCVAKVTKTETTPLGPSNLYSERVRVTTMTVTNVLKGEAAALGSVVTLRQRYQPGGPVPTEIFPRAIEGQPYLTALQKYDQYYSPVTRLGVWGWAQEVTSRTVAIPPDAPLQEKINLVLLATLRDFQDDVQRAERTFIALEEEHASADSPHYDLLAEYRRFENHPHKTLRARALYGRLRAGDTSALGPALVLAPEVSSLALEVPKVLGTLGDDGVTTLCLIVEGKYLPGSKSDALLVLRNAPHPAALPTLIKALDDPDGGVRYMAYTAIESTIGKGKHITTVAQFLGETDEPFRIKETKWDPPTSHSLMLIRKMKDWWEAEGKRQFDYVLPREQK